MFPGYYTLAAQCFGLPSLVIGLLVCFFGFVLFKASLRVTGFLVGAAIGAGLALAFSGRNDPTALIIILGLVVGVIGAWVAVPLHFVFTFLGGGALGSLIVSALLFASSNGRIPPLTDGLVLVSFVIAGVLAVVIESTFIVVGTSLSGAFGAVAGFLALTGSMRGLAFTSRSVPTILLLGTLALAVAGMYFQFKRLPPKGGRPVTPPLLPTTFCPNCRNAVQAGSGLCPHCGVSLTGQKPVLLNVTCPNCGEINPGGARHCQRCGQSLEAQGLTGPQLTCANCGQANPTGARHCQKCGQALEPAQPPEQAQPVFEGLPCPNCKQVNPIDASHCSKCGQSLEGMIPLPPVPLAVDAPAAGTGGSQTRPYTPDVDAGFAPEPFVLPTFKTPVPALEMFCPRCHAPNPPGRRSCIQCNTSLAAANGNAQPLGDPATYPDQAVCPRCGHANRAGWGYCQECGGALPQAAGLACPNCGNPLAANAAFCGKCGTRM